MIGWVISLKELGRNMDDVTQALADLTAKFDSFKNDVKTALADLSAKISSGEDHAAALQAIADLSAKIDAADTEVKAADPGV